MPDGATEGAHLESAARQWAMLGKKPPKALAPIVEPEPCPQGGEALWQWFNEIACGLDANGFSVPVISWMQLDAWCRLRNVTLEPWEAWALVQLGMLRASVLSEKPTTPKGAG